MDPLGSIRRFWQWSHAVRPVVRTRAESRIVVVVRRHGERFVAPIHGPLRRFFYGDRRHFAATGRGGDLTTQTGGNPRGRHTADPRDPGRCGQGCTAAPRPRSASDRGAPREHGGPEDQRRRAHRRPSARRADHGLPTERADGPGSGVPGDGTGCRAGDSRAALFFFPACGRFGSCGAGSPRFCCHCRHQHSSDRSERSHGHSVAIVKGLKPTVSPRGSRRGAVGARPCRTVRPRAWRGHCNSEVPGGAFSTSRDAGPGRPTRRGIPPRRRFDGSAEKDKGLSNRRPPRGANSEVL